MIGNPFFSNPYGLIPGKSPGSKGDPGGRPKKVKPSFALLDTKDGFVMPKIKPEVMTKAEECLKSCELPPNLRPRRSRALQTKTNENVAKAMAKSKNVRNSL